MWYWIFKYVLIGPVLRVFGRPTIDGAHHIPASGPVILASNHLTVVDSFFLVLMVRRRITFVGYWRRGLSEEQLRAEAATEDA